MLQASKSGSVCCMIAHLDRRQAQPMHACVPLNAMPPPSSAPPPQCLPLARNICLRQTQTAFHLDPIPLPLSPHRCASARPRPGGGTSGRALPKAAVVVKFSAVLTSGLLVFSRGYLFGPRWTAGFLAWIPVWSPMDCWFSRVDTCCVPDGLLVFSRGLLRFLLLP